MKYSTNNVSDRIKVLKDSFSLNFNTNSESLLQEISEIPPNQWQTNHDLIKEILCEGNEIAFHLGLIERAGMTNCVELKRLVIQTESLAKLVAAAKNSLINRQRYTADYAAFNRLENDAFKLASGLKLLFTNVKSGI